MDIAKKMSTHFISAHEFLLNILVVHYICVKCIYKGKQNQLSWSKWIIWLYAGSGGIWKIRCGCEIVQIFPHLVHSNNILYCIHKPAKISTQLLCSTLVMIGHQKSNFSGPWLLLIMSLQWVQAITDLGTLNTDKYTGPRKNMSCIFGHLLLNLHSMFILE